MNCISWITFWSIMTLYMYILQLLQYVCAQDAGTHVIMGY